jgi:hypothetical protein
VSLHLAGAAVSTGRPRKSQRRELRYVMYPSR